MSLSPYYEIDFSWVFPASLVNMKDSFRLVCFAFHTITSNAVYFCLLTSFCAMNS